MHIVYLFAHPVPWPMPLSGCLGAALILHGAGLSGGDNPGFEDFADGSEG